MAKVEKVEGKPFEIDVKRFYIPYTVQTTCAKCGVEAGTDFTRQYLSHPIAGEPFDHVVWCTACDGETTVKLRLDVTLKEASDETGAGKCSCDHAPCKHDAHRFLQERDEWKAKWEALFDRAVCCDTHEQALRTIKVLVDTVLEDAPGGE